LLDKSGEIVLHNANKRRVSIKTIFIAFFTIGFFSINVFAQQNMNKTDSMVVQFYAKAHKSLYWFPSDENLLSSIKDWFSGKGVGRAQQWLTALESADSLGIIENKGQISQIRAVLSSKTKIDVITKAKTDTLLTHLVLHFIQNLEQGNSHFDCDEISVNHDSLYIAQLLKAKFTRSVSKVISSLDCKDHDYQVYKKFLRDSILVPASLHLPLFLLLSR